MAKLNIRKSFEKKRVRYGGFATILSLIIIAIVLVLNLVVDNFNIKFDLSKNKLYSLSEQTDKVLDSLDKEVKVMFLEQAGQDNTSIKEIVEKYQAHSKKIKIEVKDPDLNPQLVQKYSKDGKGISSGSVIVECGNKFKVINGYEMLNFNSNSNQVESIAVEKNITSAIMYVTAEKTATAYVLKGHNETVIPADLARQFENENIERKDVDILKDEFKPVEGDLLVVVSPKRDLSKDETTKVKDFLGKGGRALFLMDLIKEDLPNFKEVLNYYGVDVNKAVVVENNPSFSAKNPLWLIPKLESHDIVSSIDSSDLKVIIPAVQPIEQLKMKRNSTKVEPILTSSSKSFGKTDLSNQDFNKAANDINGPLNLAVAVTDASSDGNTNKDTRIVVVGTSAFMDPTFNSVSNGANNDFFLNSVNWLKNDERGISVRPKSLQQESLNITQFQALLTSGIVVIAIPLIVLVSGLVVWIKRRHL